MILERDWVTFALARTELFGTRNIQMNKKTRKKRKQDKMKGVKILTEAKLLNIHCF